jgi:hypothetical protein
MAMETNGRSKLYAGDDLGIPREHGPDGSVDPGAAGAASAPGGTDA